MVYKITLDAGLMSASPAIEEVNVLKKWESEGKLEIHEADRAKELAAAAQKNSDTAPAKGASSPASRWAGRARPPQKKNSATVAAFNQVSAILFPFKDSHKLDMGQINNVVRLIRHQNLDNRVFVTLNQQDYIEQGKRESLRNNLKIVVMTPGEVVAMLRETEGWGGKKVSPQVAKPVEVSKTPLKALKAAKTVGKHEKKTVKTVKTVTKEKGRSKRRR